MTASDPERSNDSLAIFPDYKVAVSLFQSYESSVEPMCSILHIPTARSMMKSFYLTFMQGGAVLPGRAALILSILSLGAIFCQNCENSEVTTCDRDAVHLSKALSKGALDVLDYSRRNTSGSLEDIQAHLLMSFATFQLDGFSARGRILLMDAISIARDLGLHRLDADLESSIESENDVRHFIDHEVKRRVFWYIASTEWYECVPLQDQSNLTIL